MNVIVIGAGLSGLSAALHLRGQGHHVTVLERAAVPGGRSGRIERDGFTFDSGPTVFTMVDLLDQAFRAVGRRADDYLTMQLLDPAYRACFDDGSTLHVRHGVEAMRAEIARECGSVDAAAYEEFVVWLRKLYLAELPHFIDVNFDRPTDLLRNPVDRKSVV
jgi:phytoene desaturase